jgi:hypothetical protein
MHESLAPSSAPSDRRIPRRPFIVAVIGLAVAIVVAGCGIAASPSPFASPVPSSAFSVEPSASPAPVTPDEAAAVYAEIEDQVVSLRGLEPKADVSTITLDETGLQDYLQKSFFEDNPPDYVDSYSRFYQALGLLGPDDDLGELYVTLLTSEVLGLYDPDDKQLYVVTRTGDVGPLERFTYSHEYDHALQDQHFDSNSILPDELDQGDRNLARLSLLEGDATLLMTQWAQGNLTAEELQVVIAAAADPESEAIYEAMPPILRDSLAFPYDAGLLFVLDAYGRGGWEAVDELYADPPDSTEQILHVDKYRAGEAPIEVKLPSGIAASMGDGWKESFQDTLGEFTLREWLPGGPGTTVSDEAAAGWGGDRAVFLEGPSDAYAAAIVTEWDTADDADEFVAEATSRAATLAGEASIKRSSDTRVVVLLASDAAALGGIADALELGG